MQRKHIATLFAIVFVSSALVAHAEFKITGESSPDAPGLTGHGAVPAVAPASASVNPTPTDLRRLEAELKGLRADYDRVAQELAHLKKDFAILKENAKTDRDTAQKSADNLAAPPRSRPVKEPEPAKLEPLKERLRYTVPFGAYSQEFNPTEKAANEMIQYAKRADRVVVTGYTAGNPSPSNEQVAINRAFAVRRFLLGNGIPSDKISVGGGSGKHIADDSTPEGRIKNRRVEVDFLPAM
ncbi:MAG: OmpA family protein [Betaproteobacteria bacterium]|nr:OmpA family protein [Betaproteobacteria bacterium]